MNAVIRMTHRFK